MKYLHGGLVLLLAFLLSGCAATGTDNMTDTLKPCPASPNCVCSDDDGMVHNIAPLKVSEDMATTWQTLVEVLQQDKQFTVITNDTNRYLRGEARTSILRFVDDVEFQARPDEGVIAVRSASRLGFSDLGANRRRIESLRARLVERGVVQAP